MHPLAPELSSLSDDEVQKKLSDLQKRFQQAYRFGPQTLVPQIQMMIEHYQAEVQRRNRKQMEDFLKKAEGKGFKNIIDIQ
jgi:hypothetical protein